MIDSADTPKPLQDIARRLFVLLLMLLVIPAALATLLAKSANVWWFAELAVHFKIQYLVLGLLAVGPAIWLRRWVLVALCVLCIIVNANPVAQYFGATSLPGPPVVVTPQTHANIRIASLNVWFGNVDFERVANWIEAVQPDVVVLVETTTKWQDELARRLPDWPNQHLEIVSGQSGKMILSKDPFASIGSIGTNGPGEIRAPLPVATINIDGVMLRLAAIHTHWPIGASNAASRNRSLATIAQTAKNESSPLIVAGDFNASPFSPFFESMLTQSSLKRGAAGFGWLPTWPHFLPVAGIQIDHILVPPDVTVTDFSVHKGLGSDHHGIVANLKIPRR